MRLRLKIDENRTISEVMEQVKKTPRKSIRNQDEIAGITYDGIRILKAGPATHFTDKEITDIIIAVRDEASKKPIRSRVASSRIGLK
jgi:folate-dependent tRNA-U54 methylase TrmFO/GidA